MSNSIFQRFSKLNFFKPYTEKERHIFPGRLGQAAQIIQAIKDQNICVLHGPAGCGKTSFLQAQAIPELRSAGFKIISVQCISDPAIVLKHETPFLLTEQFSPIQIPRLLSQLITGTELDHSQPTVLFFDQLEQLLGFYSAEYVSELIELLLRATHTQSNSASPLVHLVFSIRSDFLQDLKTILSKKQSPEDFRKMEDGQIHSLPHLDANEAVQALEAFTRHSNIMLMPDLMEKITTDFKRMNLRTIDLNFILCRIYRDHQSKTKLTPIADPKRQVSITVKQYQDLGGTIKIVRTFVDDELEHILQRLLATKKKTRRQFGSNLQNRTQLLRELAICKSGLRAILGCFTAPGGLSMPMTRRAVVHQVLNTSPGLTRSKVNQMIAALLLERLLYRNPVSECSLELVHSALTFHVTKWFEPVPESRKRNEIQAQIRRTLLNAALKSSFCSAEELSYITSQGSFVGFGRQELNWLFKSSLLSNTDTNYWYNRLKSEKISAEPLLSSLLEGANYRTRVIIVKSLYKIGATAIVPLAKMLADEFPQVRSAAAAALSRLDPSLQWHRYLVKECYVPAGEFIQGTYQGNFEDEGPAHSIYLPGFYIGKTPVTNQEYQRFAEDTNLLFSFPMGMDRHPVVNVTWFEAREYVNWGSLRLPTEAEWEKAASWAPDETLGFTKRRYPWGNYFDEAKCNMRAHKLNGTTRVGSFSQANGDSPWGCTDMAGNVWEWTSTLFKPYPYNPDDGREDPSAVGSRVIRGGSYKSGSSYVTCTVRLPFDPYSKREDIGFRYVLNLPDVDQW